MNRTITILLILAMFLILCSCAETNDTSVMQSTQNISSQNSSSQSNSENRDDSFTFDYGVGPEYTHEVASKEATNIMFAYCSQILNSENDKAVFLFGVIEEHKDTKKFDINEQYSIKVVGDIDKYDYKNTYAPDNSYLLWLIYDENENVYKDIGIDLGILPLMEREPLGSFDSYEQFRQEIIDLNYHRAGQVHNWMYGE